jgi:hypothetical protein
MCDAYLGKILDLMDEYDLWKDTMLIVNTDHGFLLSEHDWWAKMVQPVYNEIAHIPLFIWDPRSGRQNERRNSLVQTIDLAPTILEFFSVSIPESMEGFALKETLDRDAQVREAGLFGVHGSHVNITDGRYIYMRGPANMDNLPLFEYTLMPTHMASLFGVNELQNIDLNDPFPFTKGCRTMKIDARGANVNPYVYGSLLFDLEKDPAQENPIKDPEIEKRMVRLMINLMKKNHSPEEQFERLGLPFDDIIEDNHLHLGERIIPAEDQIESTDVVFHGKGKMMYYMLLNAIPRPWRETVIQAFEEKLIDGGITSLDEDTVLEIYMDIVPDRQKNGMMWLGRIIKQKGTII